MTGPTVAARPVTAPTPGVRHAERPFDAFADAVPVAVEPRPARSP